MSGEIEDEEQARVDKLYEDSDREYQKQRLERIATAVLAGIAANPEWGHHSYSEDAAHAANAARALIAELDKEEPRG